MNAVYLNIRQEYARIDVRTQNAKLDLNAKLGELDITTQPAVLDIQNKNGRLEIDSTPCRYAIGIKNSADFNRDAAQEGMQAMQGFIARIVNNGKQFSQSTAKTSEIVANMAVSNSKTSQPAPGVTLKHIDKPRYNYTPGKLNISYQSAKVNTNVAPARFENNTQAGSVSISMAQQPSIRKWITEGKFDMYA